MNEQYHAIPTEAHQHLEQITDDPIRQHVASYIQKLHLVENLHEQQQLAAEGAEVEFTPTFAVDSERVKHHMSSIAEHASAAHAELSSGQEAAISTSDIWSRVLERQVTAATEAKQRGDSEAATSSLVDYLITTRLTHPPNGENRGWGGAPEAQSEKISKILDETIANGLAEELVEAARQSYGLVHMEAGDTVPDEYDALFGHAPRQTEVTSVANTIEAVIPQLEIVTDRVVSLDPAEPGLGEKLMAKAVKERVEHLSLEGAVATAIGVVAAEQYDKSRKSGTVDQLTSRALTKFTEGSLVHLDKAGQLARLSEANPSISDPSKFQKEFRAIRNFRSVNTHYRNNTQEIHSVDKAMVELWKRGQKSIAGRILTAGNEIDANSDYPGGAIGHIVGRDPELVQEIKTEVERRQQECRQKLEAALIAPHETPTQYSGYDPERYNADSVINKVMKTQDPERATEIVLGWAKNNNANKILSTLHLMDSDPDEGGGRNLLLILTGKENPITDLDEVSKVMTAVSDMSRNHHFPDAVVRDSMMLDNSEAGLDLRQRVAFLHAEFPLNLLDNSSAVQKIKLFGKVIENSDPQFVDSMRSLLKTAAISGLQAETFVGASDTVLKLLTGAIDAESTGKYLEEQAAYLASLESMMAHPLFERLKHLAEGETYNSFNTLILNTVTTTHNPAEGINNVDTVLGSELMSSIKSLHEVAPSEAINELVAEIARTSDISALTQEWKGLAEQLKAVAEHPLIGILRSGGMLNNMAPAILNGVLSSENKAAFCESVYASFTKPQPLWKSLTRFTELLVGEKVESLGAKQKHEVPEIPFIRVKLGVSPEKASLDEIVGFEPHAFAQLTVEQKRTVAADQLTGLSNEEVAGLASLSFDKFTDRVKRVIFAYQLQQTVEQSRDSSLKEQADLRNKMLATQGVSVVQQGDFIHGTAFDSLPSILQDGNVAGEARRSASRTDSYPYNVDLGVINGAETVQEKIESSISFQGYGHSGNKGKAGQVLLVYKRNSESWMAGQETSPGEHHALIFGGIPSTEISGLVVADPSATLSSISRTVVENSFYIPVYDSQGTILFTPDQYSQMKEDLNMSVQIPPENIVDSSVKAEDQKGVSEGGLYLFPTEAGPERYYVKFAENPDHTWTEYAADELYRVAGVAVPDTKVVIVEGRIGRASRWVEEGSELPQSESSTLEDGAAMDMLLANWDVVYNDANTMTVNGKVLRPDSGSALDIWATGVPKIEGTWTDEVGELAASNDRSKLWNGMRQEYPNLTDGQLADQVQQIQARLTDTVIDRKIDSIRRPQAAREALKATLKARRDDMVAKVLKTIPNTSVAA